MDDVDRPARLDAWFRAHADRVLAYLLHRTDPETAQDVLQEVFVTAFRKAADVPEPPIGWLLGTARRLLANNRRGDRRRDQLAQRIAAQPAGGPAGPAVPAGPAGRAGPAGLAGPVEDGAPAGVAAALAQLSSLDREVLTLSAWYELTAEEAAEALGCSPSAYAVRLHRARRRLADRLRAAGYSAPRLPEAVHD